MKKAKTKGGIPVLGFKRMVLGRLSDMAEVQDDQSHAMGNLANYLVSIAEGIRQNTHTLSQFEGRERGDASGVRTVHAKLDEQHRATRGLIEVLTTEVRGYLNSMAKERQSTRQMLDNAIGQLAATDLGELVTHMRQVATMRTDLSAISLKLGHNFGDWRKQVGAYTSATMQAIAPAEDAADQRPLRAIVKGLEEQVAKCLQRIELEGQHAGGRSNMHLAQSRQNADRVDQLATEGASLHAQHIATLERLETRLSAALGASAGTARFEGMQGFDAVLDAIYELDQRMNAQSQHLTAIDRNFASISERTSVNGAMYAEMRTAILKLLDWQEGHNARFEVIERAQITNEAEAEARHSSSLQVMDGHARKADERHTRHAGRIDEVNTRQIAQHADLSKILGAIAARLDESADAIDATRREHSKLGSGLDVLTTSVGINFGKVHQDLESHATDDRVKLIALLERINTVLSLEQGNAKAMAQLEAEYQNRASATAEAQSAAIARMHRDLSHVHQLLTKTAERVATLYGAGGTIEVTADDERPYGSREELGERIEEVYNLLDMRTSLGPVNEPADRIEVIRQRLGTILRQHVQAADSSS